MKSESRPQRFQHWFRMFDANRDGYIDKDDYIAMAEITFDEYLANYRRHQFSDDVMPFYFCAD